jgi:hypothetical protein
MSSTNTTMKGNPWTFGPDEADKHMAAGECSKCGAQLSSEYVEGRGAAVKALVQIFRNHECDPVVVEKLQKGGRKHVGVPWKEAS